MIVAIANQKGGVGKTTVAVHLAAYLANLDYAVCLCDADPQGNLTTWITGHHDLNGLYSLITARQPPPIRSILTTLADPWNLALVAGNHDTAAAMAMYSAARRPFNFISQRLQPLRAIALLTLIDMPPSQSAGFDELLYSADFLLVPTQLERHSLEGVSLMAKTSHRLLAEHGRAPALLGIIPNQARHTREHHARLDELKTIFAGLVWPPIPNSIRVSEATSYGETVFSYAPTNPAAQALSLIAQRFIVNSGLLT